MYIKVLLLVCIFISSCKDNHSTSQEENSKSHTKETSSSQAKNTTAINASFINNGNLLPKNNYLVLNINDVEDCYNKYSVFDTVHLKKIKDSYFKLTIENFSISQEFKKHLFVLYDITKEGMSFWKDLYQNIRQCTLVFNDGDNKNLVNFSLIVDSKKDIINNFLKKYIEHYNKNKYDAVQENNIPKEFLNKFTKEEYKGFQIKKYKDIYTCFAKGKNFIFSSKEALQNSLHLLGNSKNNTLANNDDFIFLKKEYDFFLHSDFIAVLNLFDQNKGFFLDYNKEILTTLGIRKINSIHVGLKEKDNTFLLEGKLKFQEQKGILDLFPTTPLRINNIPKFPKNINSLKAFSLDINDFIDKSYEILTKIGKEDIQKDIYFFKQSLNLFFGVDANDVISALGNDYYIFECDTENLVKSIDTSNLASGFVFEIKDKDLFKKILKNIDKSFPIEIKRKRDGNFTFYYKVDGKYNLGIGVDDNFFYYVVGTIDDFFLSLKKENHSLFNSVKAIKTHKPILYGIDSLKEASSSKVDFEKLYNINLDYYIFKEKNSFNLRCIFSFKEKNK